MPETLDFEEPIATLLKETRGAHGRCRAPTPHQRRSTRCASGLDVAARRSLRVADAVAARAGGPPPEPAGPRGLHRAAVHRLRRDPRRSPVRRRSRDHDRLRRLPRPAGAGRRPRQGRRHQGQDLPQLRLRAARGLPQGAARDAPGREVQPADRRVRRHAGGVPGHRVRRARRRRSHRRQPARHDAARHADHRHRQRRGRQRRRARHRGRRLAS